MNNKILIIGAGKVGTATGLSLGNNVDYHDPFRRLYVNNFNDYDYAIICVDTLQSGADDYADIESVLGELSLINYNGIVVIRSTVSPKKIDEWDKLYKVEYLLFPEFMSQRDGQLSVENAWVAVIGGDPEISNKFSNDVLLKNNYLADRSLYRHMSKKEAAVVKLSNNAALSAKLILFNAIYKICQDFECSYDDVRSAIVMDNRIGGGHSIVPSPDDGMLGFGGHCLPKDLVAISEIDTLGLFKKISDINNNLRK